MALRWLAGVWAPAGADLAYLTVGVGGPLADLADLVGPPPLAVLDQPMVHGVGFAVAVLGIVLVLVAQLSLGASWRSGIDETECADLVTTGGFRVVRNPIFAAVIVAFLGMALMASVPRS